MIPTIPVKAIIAGGALVFAVGAVWYIITAERAKIELRNVNTTIEGIRDARTIENETRDAPDDGLRDILTNGVQ